MKKSIVLIIVACADFTAAMPSFHFMTANKETFESKDFLDYLIALEKEN